MPKKEMKVQNTEFVEFVEFRMDKMIREDYPATSINILSACASFRPDRKIMQSIEKKYTAIYEEVSSVEEDYVEAYSFLSKRQRKNFLTFLGEVLTIKTYVTKDDSKQIRFRKPRRKKEKTPEQITAKLNYRKEDKDLQLQSFLPRKLINCSGCLIYQSKTRKLMLFVARTGLRLSVKGSKITNFDIEVSGSKTLRKPKEVLEDLNTISFAKAKKYYREIKAKSTVLTGSINKLCILYRVF